MHQKPSRLFNIASKGICLLLVSGVFTLASAQNAPERAEITSVDLSGSGCDQAEVSVSLSPDYKDISLLFDNYIAEIGTGSVNPSRLELTKDCQISLRMQVPAGWQMAFRAVDYRGYVNLSSQAWAFQRFSILQDGAPIISMREASLKGPMNDDYYVRSEVRPERLTWSPCLSGETRVRLMSQLGVRLNPRSTDRSFTQITLDSADGSLQQNLAVEWRRCSGAGMGGGGRPGREPGVGGGGMGGGGRGENPREPGYGPGRGENPREPGYGPGRGEPQPTPPRIPERPGRYTGR